MIEKSTETARYRQQRARWGRWTKPDKRELCTSARAPDQACSEFVSCGKRRAWSAAKRSFLYKMCMHARPFKEQLRDVMMPGQLQSRAAAKTLRCTRELSSERARTHEVHRSADIEHRASRPAAAALGSASTASPAGSCVHTALQRCSSTAIPARSRFAQAHVQGAYSTRSAGRRLVDSAVIPCRHTRRAAQHKARALGDSRTVGRLGM